MDKRTKVLLDAFAAGMTWAATTPQAAHDMASDGRIAMAAAAGAGHAGDAEWLAEFGLGAAAVAAQVATWLERHAEQHE